MPRSGPNGTYTLPGAQATQVAGTPIPSAVNNQGYSDIEQTFNTVQPVPYGGTGVADGKPLDNTFGVKNSTDPTKIGVFNAANIPAGQTRTYDLPYYSGTLGLVSDIRGQIYGLTLSNNVTDPINDIDIAAGAAVDSTGALSMVSPSSFTKRLDAAWAVGSGNGGLMSAAALTNTTYHVFEIYRPGVALPDFGFDVSPTSPTLPSGYTYFRRIGSIQRVSNAIVAFVQTGDDFSYINGPNVDRNSTAAQANTLLTVFVPTGIVVDAKISVQMTATAGIDAGTNMADGNLATANVPVCYVYSTGQTSATSVVTSFRTNTSGQVRYSVTINAGALAGVNAVRTWGYTDRRGRDA